jgi:hypothetical protein
MSEYWKRYYAREEEFLDEFNMRVGAALKILGDDWRPDWQCDDGVRRNREYFLKSGELSQLVFDGASVYHDEDGFSSTQIVLKSSKRLVNVRVSRMGNEFIAEKIMDRPVDGGKDQ